VRAYSSDLRQRVLADSDAGMSTEEVAAKYRVSASWVRRLKQRRRETGSAEPKPQRHGPSPSWAAHTEAIATAVRERPDDTLEEHRARLGLGLSTSALWRAIKALGLTVKKSPEGCRAGSARRSRRPPAVAGRDAGPPRGVPGVH